MKKSKDILDYLPIMAWENDCLVSKFADITVALELSLPEVYSLGTKDYENFHLIWTRALRVLPNYTIVHKQDIFYECDFLDKPISDSFLSISSSNHFKNRRFLNHKSYVYITLSTKENLKTTSFLSILCRNKIVPNDMLDKNRWEDFNDKVSQFISILSENGIGVSRSSKKAILGGPHQTGALEQYLTLEFDENKKVMMDVYLEDNDFKIGDNYLSCFSIGNLDELPSNVYEYVKDPTYSHNKILFPMSFTSPLAWGIPFSHIYNQYFFLDDPKQTLSDVEKSGRQQQSFSAVSRENLINKKFNDDFLNESVSKNLRPIRAAMNIMIWDKNYNTLVKKNSLVAAKLSELDICVSQTNVITPQIYWAGIPGGESQYPSEMTFLTFIEPAVCLIQVETCAKPIELDFGIRLCDRLNGIPLKVDISDIPMKRSWINNRNKFILGPSGSGKSFFTNHIVRQYYEQGTHVVIVDVGDSYLGLCKLINEETDGKDGVYYTYTEDNPISFNPFFVKDNVYTIEKKEQLSSLIFCLWKSETENITKAEETHISTAINDYIDLIIGKKTTPSFTCFYNFLKKDFKKKLQENKVERNHFDIENLLQVLRPYSEGGMYDYLLNAKENIDLLEKRFIVFEIDNIKDHKTLFPIVTLILMDTFISKMRHPSLGQTRKMILIEEAWKAISKAGTAEFIKYLFKTVRKHFGEAVVVTQEIEDIIGNEIVKNSILGNADCKILLDQRKYANSFDDIAQILGLTEKDIALALSLNQNLNFKNRNPYKEVFITLNGNNSNVYALEVSRQEYLVYTTEKTEKSKLMELEKQTGSIINAINKYVNLNF